MSLTGSLMKVAARRAAGRFEAAARDPVATQTALLLSMVRRNAGTEYGRRHGFDTIRSVADYRARVPVVDYERIREDMDRVVHGARNVFTVEDPVMFAQTSGTTGAPKYIPVTPTCRGRSHRDVMRAWLWHASRDHPTLVDKVVSLVSPAVEGTTPCGIPFGSTSGDAYRNQPWIVRRRYPIPYGVFEIGDYNAKYYALMRLALEQSVTFLATANPSSILKMCQKGDEFAEEIIRDIRDGSLSRDFEIEPVHRQTIERGLRPNRVRAAELERARSRRNGRLVPADYWGRLAMIGCWKGGTVGHYVARFPEWFDPDGVRAIGVRDVGYLSSEFRGSVPIEESGNRGVLTVATNFYEFVEVEDLESRPQTPGDWRFLTVEDLQDGTEYYIFVTTTGGLYRYDINDVIRVEGRYHGTPQVVFARKGRGMTNITGEKISVDQIISAMAGAAREVGADFSHFKAKADLRDSRYVFQVEFAELPDIEKQRGFLRALDGQLMSLNIEYRSKRKSLRLKPPVLWAMRSGWYERDRKRLSDTGRRVFQAKTNLLSTTDGTQEVPMPEIHGVVELPGVD